MRLFRNMVIALANTESDSSGSAVMTTDHTNNFIQSFEWKLHDVPINVI